MTGGSREDLRVTFDSAADRYHRARPRYPVELFDRLEEATGIAGSAAHILEIGPATGIATEELAQRGHRVTGIELGAALANRARQHLARFPQVQIVEASFDEWEPPSWGESDVVVAATSWHWLDPSTRVERAWRHLAPGGHLAIWTAGHVGAEGGDPFFAEIQDVYDEIGMSGPGDDRLPRPGELPEFGHELTVDGRFELVTIEHLDWAITYDADGYLDLLDTFSGHIAMAPWQRERLYGEIRRRLAERPDGLLRRGWGAVLHVARRVDHPG